MLLKSLWYCLLAPSLWIGAFNHFNNMQNPDIPVVYAHDGKFFDLDKLEFLKFKPEQAQELKREAYYASFFGDKLKNEAYFKGRRFELTQERTMNIYEDGKIIHSVLDPDSTVKLDNISGNTSLFASQFGVVSIMRLEGENGYRILKYDQEGKVLSTWRLPHTKYKREGNTIHSQPYLYFRACTDNELVFSSIHSTGPQETIVLNLMDGSQKTSEKTIGGIILHEKEFKLAGLITYKDKFIEVEVLGNTWTIPNINGYNTVKTVLNGNILYVASYHWVSTGSALDAYDVKTGKHLWKGEVRQMNTSHSEYYNTVYLTLYKDRLVLEGEEAHGNYLQVLDARNGTLLFSTLPDWD